MAGAGYWQQLWDLHPMSIPAVSSLVVLHLGICGIAPREGFPLEVIADGEGIQTLCACCIPGACLGLARVLPASSATMGCRAPGRASATNVGIQEFPKCQVQDPGRCLCIWSVELKPFSLPEFDGR